MNEIKLTSSADTAVSERLRRPLTKHHVRLNVVISRSFQSGSLKVSVTFESEGALEAEAAAALAPTE